MRQGPAPAETKERTMRLIIAEKPSVARAIAGALGRPTKHDGYLRVGSDLVSWALGHLVQLAEPEVYDPTWKRWSWDALPMLPDAFWLAPIPSGRGQLKILKDLLKRSDATQIVCATDADREGELIFRWIARHLGVKQPVSRLWLSETTPSAIQAAFQALKPASVYDALAEAAEARAQADWLVGLNATRAMTLRHGQRGQGALSVGRVQTPTLKLIADRDGQIERFTPTPYWQVRAAFEPEGDSAPYAGFWVKLPAEEPADRIPDQATAEQIAAAVPSGTPGTIRSVDRKRATVKPPALYNLADVQKDANRRWGLTAGATLQSAQALYEARLTTYPRTDARAVSAAEAATLSQRLKGLQKLYPELHAALPTPLPVGRVTDDAVVAKTGHPAIIITGQVPGSDLGERERKIFDLIARRTFAALLPAGTDERATVLTDAGRETWRTKGTAVVTPGWRIATRTLPEAKPDAPEDDADSGGIPPGLRTGQRVTVQDVEILSKQTKPPARLTDASLLALMEKNGLGTPATRAAVLDTLIRRLYVQREKKSLVSTEKGRAVLAVAPPALQSPDLTGQWEAQLEAIAAGAGDAATFLQGIRQYTTGVVTTVKGQTGQAIGSDLGACPVCHQGRVIAGREGWGCSRWRDGCRFTIWREVAGKRLTNAQVKALLAGKTTGPIRGFKSKAGKDFAARLKLDGERVVFVFEERRSPIPRRAKPTPH